MTAAEDVAATVQQALADWLADNGGGFVTSFAFSLEYIDEDGDLRMGTRNHGEPITQPNPRTTALAHHRH